MYGLCPFFSFFPPNKSFFFFVGLGDGICTELTLLRNRGELAEGWYEPETLRKARASATASASASRTAAKTHMQQEEDDARSGDLSDDDVGPALPRRNKMAASSSRGESERHGPAVPNLQDLELRRGMHAFFVIIFFVFH